jgi:type VI secretion system FHA domain protein
MITIKVTTYDGKPLGDPLHAEFRTEGGTIGRAPGSALVLPDPDRVISRAHATVFVRDGRFCLRDQGSASPTMVNGRAIGPGHDIALDDGDEIRIGRYVMVVEDLDATHRQHAKTDAATAPVLSWSDGGDKPAEGITTFVVGAPGAADGAAAPPVAGAQPAPAEAPHPPAARASIDGAATLPLHTSMREPRASPSAQFSEEELLQAFLVGAGIPTQAIAGGLTPQRMYEVGQLLREATQGMLDLLLARAATKREVRADMTIIVTQDNNPLKFSPNIDAALAALLAPRGRGFMPPLRAVRDAYEGLTSHQQGFIAGMRAVLALALARFNPVEFDRRVAQRSMADSLLPMNRKAKLWDLFTELYGEMSKEAAAEFHALFGQEFLRAYDAQIARLRETSEGTPRP